MQALLEDASDAHLDGVKLRGNSQVQIEETVIHRLEAQGKRQLIAGLGLHLCVAGH